MGRIRICIYLQATAMTESLYLALFIWAVALFFDFLVQSMSTTALGPPDQKSGLTGARCIAARLCLAGAELTRYDGWFLAAVIGAGRACHDAASVG